jgi:hypothetical protein
MGSDINRRLVVGLRPAPPPPQEDGGEDKEQAKDGGDQEFAVGFHWVGWLESAVLVISPGLGWGLAGEVAGAGASRQWPVRSGRAHQNLDGPPAGIGLGLVRTVGERIAGCAKVRDDGFGDAAEFGCLAGIKDKAAAADLGQGVEEFRARASVGWDLMGPWPQESGTWAGPRPSGNAML